MLNVNPTGIIPKVSNFKFQKKRASNLISDTFIKSSNNISFNGTSSSDEQDKKTKFLHTQLPEILSNPKNKIGQGFSHTVYNIPSNDKYVLRLNNSNIDFDFDSAVIEKNGDNELDVNIGQKVADIKITDKNNTPYNIEILRKQKGKPLGIPPSQAIFSSGGNLRAGELPYESMERKKYYASTIHETAKLPVEAYEKLLEDIKNSSSKGYVFDHLNSNNLLIDNDNKTINIIDMEKSGLKPDYGNVLYSLTNIYYFPTYSSLYDQNTVSDKEVQQALKDSIEIIDKFIEAMQNKNIKFNNQNKQSVQFRKLFTSMPFSFYCKTMDDKEKWEKLEALGVVKD